MPDGHFFPDRREEIVERRAGRPDAPSYKGHAMVAVLHATRFAQTGVPDDATMASFAPFGRRIPQMGGCHIHRVPVSSDLSLGWRECGICDAVLRLSPRNIGKSCFDFLCLYGPGGPGLKTFLSPRMGICHARWPFLPGPARRNSGKKGRPPRCSILQRTCHGRCPPRNSLRSDRRSGRRHHGVL